MLPLPLGEELSSDQWHECYHYFGSRVLNAAEWVADLLRHNKVYARFNEELIMARLTEEAAWANTVFALAETRVQLKHTRVIPYFTQLVTTRSLLDRQTQELYESFFASYATNVGAFPAYTRVWWDKKAIKHDKNTVTSIEDALGAYRADRNLIFRETAIDYLDPIILSEKKKKDEFAGSTESEVEG
ncbi:hypothetical protein NMY22_g10583 [Coprinellus aureogranulatus]|nr:hypothetical protein NMY22_g10583 [Coprinellus aureogranulatus]